MLFCGMAKEKNENVRVSTKTLNRVRRFIKKTKKYRIGNFYDLAAEEKLSRENGVPALAPSDSE